MELINGIGDTMQFFKYFSNKKQRGSTGPLLEESVIITTYMKVTEIFTNHFATVFPGLWSRPKNFPTQTLDI